MKYCTMEQEFIRHSNRTYICMCSSLTLGPQFPFQILFQKIIIPFFFIIVNMYVSKKKNYPKKPKQMKELENDNNV